MKTGKSLTNKDKRVKGYHNTYPFGLERELTDTEEHSVVIEKFFEYLNKGMVLETGDSLNWTISHGLDSKPVEDNSGYGKPFEITKCVQNNKFAYYLKVQVSIKKL